MITYYKKLGLSLLAFLLLFPHCQAERKNDQEKAAAMIERGNMYRDGQGVEKNLNFSN